MSTVYFNQWTSDDAQARFDAKVQKDTKTGCLMWTGNSKPLGYGYMRYKGKRHMAHRVAMILAGFDVEGRHVLHKCHNPSCVNVDHLYLGDHNQNMRDMANAGSKKGENHHMCRLSDSDVKRMFVLRYREGHRVVDIAKAYGISEKYASAALVGKKRSHLTLILLKEFAA